METDKENVTVSSKEEVQPSDAKAPKEEITTIKTMPNVDTQEDTKDDDDAQEISRTDSPEMATGTATATGTEVTIGEDGKNEETTIDVKAKKRAVDGERVVPTKPIKRARTAYFIFADEKRPQIQKAHPGEGVAAQAKAMGELWSSLSDEDKRVYQEKAALERERVVKETEAWLAAGGKEAEISVSKSCQDSLTLPVARIRKIVKLDPDVKGLSKEALVLVTKATELFTTKLGVETVKVAQIQNRRKLLPDDVAQVCSTRSSLMFLKPDIQDLVRQQIQDNEAAKKTGTETAKQAPEDRSGSKPLTDFFTKR